jgi:hypothetical protein
MLSLALLLSVAPGTEVLFVGNSHTYVNDLPGLFRGLSYAGGFTVFVGSSAPGGYSLREHTFYRPTLDSIEIRQRDYVVLQEQSQIPSINWCRDSLMFPAARRLDSLITGRGSNTAFYMTWGWRDGGVQSYGGHSSPDFRDYFEMQDSVSASYRAIARELDAVLVPVGEAWRLARTINPQIDLWQSDACHATLKGTYLGACVFYAVLHGEDPTGLEFYGGLSPEDARWLQDIAWQTVSGITERPVRGRAQALAVPSPYRAGMGLHLAGAAVLYDAGGRFVVELDPGQGSWDGRDSHGRDARPGVYLCRSAGSAGRLVLVR